MHGILCAPEDTPFLQDELRRLGATSEVVLPGLVRAPLGWVGQAPILVFARQFLPDMEVITATSVRTWAEAMVQRILSTCPEEKPWRLQVTPRYQTVNSTHAGENRCRLIVEAMDEQLDKKRRKFRKLRRDGTEPFRSDESLVQLLLTQPDSGWLSISLAPRPSALRYLVSPFSQGEIPIASDQSAPSRAFAKLVEAEQRLGRSIRADETCVDLGACPGSWSYVALARGAWVTAVDRTPVRDDLLRNPRLRFHPDDAFTFRPHQTVDWLICDVIAAPERSMKLILDWARERWCGHLIVTIKFKGHEEYALLDRLKQELPRVMADFGMARLCANKNEACVFGRVRH